MPFFPFKLYNIPMEDYDPIAGYYSYIARRTDYASWYGYLKELSGLGQLKGKSILDLGCGTGQLLSFFYAEGAFCQGVDTSSEMLSRADMKLYSTRSRGGSYELVKNDMALFSPRGKRVFDFAYSACDSVNYLTRQELVSLISAMKTYMAPGTVFAFDIINPLGDFDTREVIRRSEGDIVLERHVESGRFVTLVSCGDTAHSFVQNLFYEEDILTIASEAAAGEPEVFDFMSRERKDPACDKLQVILRV